MFIMNPDLINSCRVCRSPNQDGDYQCLYQTSVKHEQNPLLSEAGILYENLLEISLGVQCYYPQFLCNSCDLQMKLFKKLKDKACRTLEYLKSFYAEIFNDKEYKEVQLEEYVCLENEQIEDKEFLKNVMEQQENKFLICHEKGDNIQNEGDIDDVLEGTKSEKQTMAVDEDSANRNCNIRRCQYDIEYREFEVDAFSTCNEQELEKECLYKEQISPGTNSVYDVDTLANKVTPKIETKNTEESNQNITVNLQPLIDENDYVTEIYELLEDGNKIETYSDNHENLVEYEAYSEENEEDTSVCNGTEYVMEEYIEDIPDEGHNQNIQNANPAKRKSLIKGCRRKIATNSKRKEYKCVLCSLEFKNSQEYKLHRTQVHNEKYQCIVCSKELKSMSALSNHLRLHNEQPDYQCDICQKTFSQKAHYQYHMNNHNNIRNFKCQLCGKCFIAKADLKVHLRLHTGERPYVCNICGKDYLMMEHLKTHLLTHTEQYFQCEICNKKFTTHKTLRLHVKTIHAEQPRFKCHFCLKPFRRKHHLQYHLKLHEQETNVNLDSDYEIIDDPDVPSNEADFNPDDLVEQDALDQGFIALNDDVI